jgi:uncharacterized membrane protein
MGTGLTLLLLSIATFAATEWLRGSLRTPDNFPTPQSFWIGIIGPVVGLLLAVLSLAMVLISRST